MSRFLWFSVYYAVAVHEDVVGRLKYTDGPDGL